MTNLGIGKFNSAFNGGVEADVAPEKPISKMNKGELEAMAIAAGISAEGTVKDLRARLSSLK